MNSEKNRFRKESEPTYGFMGEETKEEIREFLSEIETGPEKRVGENFDGEEADLKLWLEKIARESKKMKGNWEEDRGKWGELLLDGGIPTDPKKLDAEMEEFEKETGLSYKEIIKGKAAAAGGKVKVGGSMALFCALSGLWWVLKLHGKIFKHIMEEKGIKIGASKKMEEKGIKIGASKKTK